MQERDLSWALMESSSEALMSFDKSAFDQLRSNRMAYVDGLRRNKGFEAGILRLLTQLYPDNAHFIYELLQNAEDAKASHARFRLTKESLIFEHDGSRLFSARDAESITSIGDSTKADSPTEIGKFGVGFKAVFAYTQTPEVHSGEYHFRIRDLVVPELLPNSPIGVDGFDTQFTFPFDHPKKNGGSAMAEIGGALQALGDATLLFLSNIGLISYVLPDGSMGSLERVLPPEMQQAGRAGEHIQVTVNSPAADSRRSNWLRYRQTVTIEDESVYKECAVAVAFGLEKHEGRTKKSMWRMIPLSSGRVCIYFPAEKETSNLRFHLHAPFASTVARDSVRDSRGNDLLLAAIAELAAASMEDIRDRGLLTVAALEVLPIEEDNLSKFYEPIREKIVQAFENQDLVPTRTGGHRASGELFRGPADISTLLIDEDLEIVTGNKWVPPLWCANPSQVNQRSDKFLDSLSIEEWGWSELSGALDCSARAIEYAEDKGRPQRLKTWLASKEDSWLQRFYALLHDVVSRHRRRPVISELCLIRAQKGDVDHMVRPSDAFFPLVDADKDKTDIMWVKKECYSSGKSDAQKNSAQLFLEYSGVRVFDEKANLTLIIDSYKGKSFPDDATHIRHIKRFVTFFISNPKSLDIFSAKHFLLGVKAMVADKRYFCTPPMICLDSPYEDTGLAAILRGNEIYTLWGGYLDSGLSNDFVEFVKAVGVQTEFSIIQASAAENRCWHALSEDYRGYKKRWTYTAINFDWTIDGIEILTRSPSIESSRLIWRALIRAEAKVATARFRPNKQYNVRRSDSQLVYWLKTTAWIPDCDGAFLPPQEISRTRLRSDFPYDNQNGLLEAIGLEHSVQRKTEEYQRRDRAAREFGFGGLDVVTELASAIKDAGLDPTDAITLIRQHAPKPALPEEEVRNPERRRRGVLEHRENAPEREAVKRERSIQANVQGVVAEAKAYLRAKYTNADGQLVCQVCLDEMPFKLGSGDYYFEAVQVLKDLGQHFYENRLALCPTCAAKFQFARNSSDDEVRAAIIAIDGAQVGSGVSVPLVLAGQPHSINFVGTHLFDLQLVVCEPEPTT